MFICVPHAPARGFSGSVEVSRFIFWGDSEYTIACVRAIRNYGLRVRTRIHLAKPVSVFPNRIDNRTLHKSLNQNAQTCVRIDFLGRVVGTFPNWRRNLVFSCALKIPPYIFFLARADHEALGPAFKRVHENRSFISTLVCLSVFSSFVRRLRPVEHCTLHTSTVSLKILTSLCFAQSLLDPAFVWRVRMTIVCWYRGAACNTQCIREPVYNLLWQTTPTVMNSNLYFGKSVKTVRLGQFAFVTQPSERFFQLFYFPIFPAFVFTPRNYCFHSSHFSAEGSKKVHSPLILTGSKKGVNFATATWFESDP